jgi:hypothetical protein
LPVGANSRAIKATKPKNPWANPLLVGRRKFIAVAGPEKNHADRQNQAESAQRDPECSRRSGLQAVFDFVVTVLLPESPDCGWGLRAGNGTTAKEGKKAVSPTGTSDCMAHHSSAHGVPFDLASPSFPRLGAEAGFRLKVVHFDLKEGDLGRILRYLGNSHLARV